MYSVSSEEPPRAHPATILVAEDEPLLREFVTTVLRGEGYHVLQAEDGVAALKLWGQEKDSIDLLFTDIVMPNAISGKDLAERLMRDRRDLKVIYTSGYNLELINSDISEEQGRWFLPKPYPPGRLTELVARALKAKIVRSL